MLRLAASLPDALGSRQTAVAHWACDLTMGHSRRGSRSLRRVWSKMESSTAPNTSFWRYASVGKVIVRSGDDGRVDSDVVQLRTGTRLVTDITDLIVQFCRNRGDGLCHVFVPHATAGLALIETGSGAEFDLEDAIDRLLPRDDIYRHRHGSPGHGRDHVLPAFVSPSLTVPVLGGRPTFGTWQSVVLVDPNVDNADRELLLSFLPG